MERKEQMLTRMAEMFDLPGDLVAGLCHTELLGDRQFFLEGHEGILSYTAEQIDISAGALIVRVKGRDLMLRCMTENEVRIQGTIECVEYVR